MLWWEQLMLGKSRLFTTSSGLHTPSYCSAWPMLCIAYCTMNTKPKGFNQANESVSAVQDGTYAYKHTDTAFLSC